jgi:ribonuclease P protein component
MIGRLVQSADFERALAVPARSRSTHFALHYVAAGPMAPRRPRKTAESGELSTTPAPGCPQAVDDLFADHWIGCVVPKRHARRAVTRSLLKRQIRAALHRHAARLPPGQWLVRLRSPFAAAKFVSARSVALACAAREELELLLARAGA